MRKIVLCLFIIFTLLSCDKKEEILVKSGKVVYIGVLLPEEQLLNHKAIDVLNVLAQNQGVLKNGDALSLEVEYVKDHPIKSFIKLCQKKELTAIISFLNSTQTLLLKNEIETKKIPIISAIATHTDITKIDYISRICINNTTQAHVAAAYLRDELFTSKVFILRDESNAFSFELSSIFIKRYEKLGGKTNTDLLDIKELLQDPDRFLRTLEKSQTDTLYISVDAAYTRTLLKLFKKHKLKLNILAHDGLLAAFVVQFPKDIELLNGLFVIDNYADNLILSKQAKKFTQAVKQKAYEVDSYDLLSYDAWSLLKKGLNTCKDNKNTCLNDYMRNCDSFEGAIETIRMQKGSAYRAAYVNEINDAKMQIKVRVY